jgi:dUTP pyrophosphatase
MAEPEQIRGGEQTLEQRVDRIEKFVADFALGASISEDIQEWIVRDPIHQDRYGIALPPGERCMVGLGFATAMSLPMFYFVLPRSGHASIGVNLDNSPGTVDPDYRGEAGALITNRSKEPFVITRDTRIIQAVFMLAIMPQLVQVDSRDDLPVSLRGVGGFGSTGVHG